MAKCIRKLLSNIFLRTGLIFFFIELLLSGSFLCLYFSIGKSSAGSISILVNIFLILIVSSAILCCVFILIMLIRNFIYGDEVKHDKDYWKHPAAEGTVLPAGTVDDPYLLAMRYQNPIPGFVSGMLVFVSIPVLASSIYIDFSDHSLEQIAALIPVIYAMIIVTVFFIRSYRRFRAFHVKKYVDNENSRKGAKLHVQ